MLGRIKFYLTTPFRYPRQSISLMLIGVVVGSSWLWWLQEKTPSIMDPFAMEKVGEGAWILHGREPVHQTVKSGEVVLNVQESKVKGVSSMALIQAQDDALIDPTQFKWSAKSSRDTTFALGLMKETEVLPVVQISREDGYFVRYYPATDHNASIQSLSNVKPKADKNVVSWELRPDITARYTIYDNKVKADYIVANAQGLDLPLKFAIEQSQGDKQLSPVLMPGGEILFLGQDNLEYFELPAPVTHDKDEKNIQSHFNFEKSIVTIVLDNEILKSSTFPLTIDPVVIDNASVSATATAYGNSRKILRDSWGNLIAIGAVTGTKGIYYKSYSDTTWTQTNFNPNTTAAADLDSSGNLHVVKIISGTLYYNKYTVSRNVTTHVITTIAQTGGTPNLDASGVAARPSMIIVNKGGGNGVEKVAVLWTSNEAGGGGGKRGETRFLQCDIADDCGTVDNWKNATESETGSSGTAGCVDGTAGLPSSATCTGAADPILRLTGSATTNHGAIAQLPGKPKRSPNKVYKYVGPSTFTDLPNTYDNSAGTNESLATFSGVAYLFIGSTEKFSKVSFDMGSTVNATADAFSVDYCSASTSGTSVCTTWTAAANSLDNTKNTAPFGEDGSILFDQPSTWALSSQNSTNDLYWIRLSHSNNFTTNTSINEIYLTDRNARALIVAAGNDSTDDLGAAYIPWDEVNNDRWENNPSSSSNGWRESSTVIDGAGANWGSFTEFPLSIVADSYFYRVYVGYVQDGLTSDLISFAYIDFSKDPTVAWTDATSVTATVAATDANFSLTENEGNLFVFYNRDPGTAGLTYRKCNRPCNSVWQTETAFDFGTDSTYPQAVITKIPGDTVAIDVIYTTTTTPAIEYDRLFLDLADQTDSTAASGDDAMFKDCPSNNTSDDQFIDVAIQPVTVGHGSGDGGCTGTPDPAYHAGLRFNGVNVANGATISSAYLDIQVTTVAGTVDFSIYGEDVDNSSAFVAVNNNDSSCVTVCVSNRTRTTANVSYNMAFTLTRYRFDVTKIIQEIVCRGASNSQPCVGNANGGGTWVANNALSLLLISNETTGTDGFQIASFDESPALKPTLRINLGSSGKDYSSGVVNSLPSGSGSYSNLDHPLSSSQFTAVGTDDTSTYDVQTSTSYIPTPYPVFMFKQQNSNNNNTYKIDASAIVKSEIPCTSKTMYLQVYRGGATNDWVTQASNNSCSALTDVTLASPTITANVSDYYFAPQSGASSAYWTYWRVYQDQPGSNYQTTFYIDFVNVSYSPNGPDHVTFTNAARTLSEKVCNGTGNKFTMQLQDSTNTATNPTGSTVIRITSNSSDYTIYSDSSCTSVATSGDFTFSTSENTKDVYIIDRAHSNPTWTLTATKQSGPDTISTGNQSYSVQAITQEQIKGGTQIRGGSRL